VTVRHAAGPPRLALEVWGHDYGRIAATAEAAEELGFGALYYGESPGPLNLETWTVLAGLAERTTTLRIGPVIANLLPGYRSFPLFARQVHALAVVSGGRLDVRTGTGAASTFARPWWNPAGIDYPDRDRRRGILDEWLAALHHLWSRPEEPLSGQHVRFDAGALGLDPPVARPPITVAAVGPASMRIAARHADVWEASYLTPAEFAALGRRFDEITATSEGGARPVLRSLEVDAVTAGSAAARRRLERRFLAERGAADPAALSKALTGTGDELARQLTAYRAAGADQLVIAAVDPHDRSTLETVAEAAARLERPD
jgi:alkanesulfonate monooxygenase SsuD/methylene tetrahydromethanopterin reductase-like flavin-dependent oxidoreductase (luciferase family)